MIKLLIFGDIVGKAGRQGLLKVLPELKEKYQPDYTIANGENAAHGKGITDKIFVQLVDAGIDLITMGDHTFERKESDLVFDNKLSQIIRPANLAGNLPGLGWRILDGKVGFINLVGQVFMNDEKIKIDNPFHTVDKIIAENTLNNIPVVVDFHAEATSEKSALGWYLDGRVALVFGTHTHVQTNDARILPNGTGFLSDIGMCGGYDSVIGDDKETVIPTYLTDKKHRMNPAGFPVLVNGIYAEIDEENKKTKKIELIREIIEKAE